MRTKPLTLHRLSIALLTTVLLLCAGVIVGQQRDNQRLRAQRDFALSSTAGYKNAFEEKQAQLEREKQINAHMEPWLSNVARQSGSRQYWNDPGLQLFQQYQYDKRLEHEHDRGPYDTDNIYDRVWSKRPSDAK